MDTSGEKLRERVIEWLTSTQKLAEVLSRRGTGFDERMENAPHVGRDPDSEPPRKRLRTSSPRH
jgi:hypothetical protein